MVPALLAAAVAAVAVPFVPCLFYGKHEGEANAGHGEECSNAAQVTELRLFGGGNLFESSFDLR